MNDIKDQRVLHIGDIVEVMDYGKTEACYGRTDDMAQIGDKMEVINASFDGEWVECATLGDAGTNIYHPDDLRLVRTNVVIQGNDTIAKIVPVGEALDAVCGGGNIYDVTNTLDIEYAVKDIMGRITKIEAQRCMEAVEHSINDVDSTNLVHHPDHYNKGGIEVFDIIDAFKLNFNMGNVIKYALRYQFKGDPIKDLKKALVYIEREIARMEEKE